MVRVIGLAAFVLVVVGLAGGYAGKAQEAATLENRVLALENQIAALAESGPGWTNRLVEGSLPPPSPGLNDLAEPVNPALIWDEAYTFFLLCREEPLGLANGGEVVREVCVRAPGH